MQKINMDNSGKISVIIPVFNRRAELKKAIESVLGQTYRNFEIIVVDDFSDDNPHELINEINDARILYIRLQKKSNANVARNVGIKSASGNFIAMLDSDDEWLSHHLERKINYMERTGADGIFGSVKIFNGKTYYEKVSREFNSDEKMIDYLIDGGFAPTPTHFYRSECVRDILFDETLKRHQDWDFSIRFSKKYKFIPDSQITVVVNWLRSQKKNTDYPSQIKFIQFYEKEMNPALYAKYHIKMFLKLKMANASPEIIEHYRMNSMKYFKHIRLVDFMSFKEPETSFSKVLARAEYGIRKFFAKK